MYIPESQLQVEGRRQDTAPARVGLVHHRITSNSGISGRTIQPDRRRLPRLYKVRMCRLRIHVIFHSVRSLLVFLQFLYFLLKINFLEKVQTGTC